MSMNFKKSSLTLIALLIFGANGASANQLPPLPSGIQLPQLPAGTQLPSIPSGATAGAPMTLTEDQIAALPEDQKKAVLEALEKAKAAAGSAPSIPSAPSAAGGFADAFKNIAGILSKLTPEQKKMVEDAQKSGKLPENFSEMLIAGTLNASVLSQLTPEQLSALQAARDSGELTEENLKAIVGQVDAATVKEVATAIKESKPINVEKIVESVKKVATIICTKGKKVTKVTGKKCPEGFKKKS